MLRVLVLGLALAAAAVQADVFEHALGPAQLADLLGPAARPLAAASGLSGHFEQRKYLASLPKPLVSSGEFLFARDQGVWWHTVQPFDSVFILTREGASSRDEGGAEARVSAADQPGVAVAARIFFALFALDFSTLAQDFDTYGAHTGSGWQVGLRPKAAGMAAVFREAVVEGTARASRIELRDPRGDRTEILLPDTTVLNGLGEAERRRFTE